jgi:uncharacterized Fe-S cluster-containing protein
MGIELVKGVDSFVKDYILRDIDSTFNDIEAHETFMQGVVSQVNTLLGAELKLMSVERS